MHAIAVFPPFESLLPPSPLHLLISYAALQKLHGWTDEQLQDQMHAEVARWFAARHELGLLRPDAFPRSLGDIEAILQSKFGPAALCHMLAKPGAQGECCSKQSSGSAVVKKKWRQCRGQS